MKNIVNQEWLLEHIQDKNLVVIDCRFSLGNPDEGMQLYKEEHIPGALYCDLEKDLSGPVKEHGGRHPMPDVKSLQKLFSRLGVTANKTVVLYDDQGGAMASRLWFLLRFAGHSKAYILNGGFTQWKAEGYPTSDKITSVPESAFEGNFQTDMVIDMNGVKKAIEDEKTILIDSREEGRFKGKHEPIDPVAGHIPSAINYFWKELLNDNGTWKSEKEIAARFANLPKDKAYIVYCGSGVTACPNIIALQEAGFTNVKLYAGSWSDWCSYPNNEISN